MQPTIPACRGLSCYQGRRPCTDGCADKPPYTSESVMTWLDWFLVGIVATVGLGSIAGFILTNWPILKGLVL